MKADEGDSRRLVSNRENGAPLSVASPEDRGCSKEAGEDV